MRGMHHHEGSHDSGRQNSMTEGEDFSTGSTEIANPSKPCLIRHCEIDNKHRLHFYRIVTVTAFHVTKLHPAPLKNRESSGLATPVLDANTDHE